MTETIKSTTAYYHTFGCKLNFAETSSIAARLASLGIQRVPDGGQPGVIVINSCSVTEEADKKCRQTIRSLHRRYPDAFIAVTGCYAQLKPDEVRALPGVAIVAGADSKMKLPDMIVDYIASRNTIADVSEWGDIRAFRPSCSRGDRTRYFLKVQDGCDYWCTYCTIPAARGRSRSGTIDEIVAQAAQAAAEGGKEIVITGVNIGDFGKGRDDRFIDLVRALDRVEGIERYRISSIEPNLLTDEVIDFVAGSRAFMPHFHIPLQSGSDAVLKLMRRRYDTALFASKIERIRREIPHAFIGVDLIAGARGETDDEFRRSHDFIESLDITRLHVFPYSERPGTKALEIGHVVSQAEKHRRVAEMMDLSLRKWTAFAEKNVGTARPVLFEHPRGEGLPMAGFTDNYLKVTVDNALPEMDNRLGTVKILSADPATESLKGILL